MRELKFRAWDKRNKKWLDLQYLLLSPDVNGKLEVLTCPHGEIGDVIFDAELMQFTGLHDKNGKEIYEGDIVKSDWGYGSKKPTMVKFADIFYWSGESCISNNIEIIGNIWENSELIK
jgi:uncharacterized phage protein (TIGR01671 family)